MSKVENLSHARKSYANVFRIIAVSSLVVHFAQLIGMFSKVAPPRQTLRHNYLWFYERKTQELSRSEQIQATLGKIIGSLSSDPIITSTLWDVLLAGESISLWALVQNIKLKALFNGLGLDNVFSGTRSRTPSTEPETDPETTPRKRGRPKKSNGDVDGAYVPSANVAAQAKLLEGLDAEGFGDQNTEGGAFTWVLFFFVGLGTALATVLGAEVSGG